MITNIGFRINNVITRPDPAFIERFRDIPVSNIADNMGRISCVQTAIKPYNQAKLLGPAFTVRVAAGDNLMFHKALDMAQEGDIIVVDGGGALERSLCGEIMVTYAKKRRLGGFLVDGCIRDVESLRRIDFPVYARGANPNGPYKNGPGEINYPVSIGNQVVNPGDIVCGDEDGVVIIRASDAEALLEKAMLQHDNEILAFKQIEAGVYDRSWIDRFLKDLGCEVIQ